MRAVVLGIGNTILSDEAAGVRTVEALEQAYQIPDNVLVIDGGTSGMEMIEDLSNLDFLLVVDVVTTGAAPGTLVKIAGAEIPVFFRDKLSPHQIGLPDVLASLELLDAIPKEIVVLGVEPISLELGLDMTPTVAATIPELVHRAVTELRARGYKMTDVPVTHLPRTAGSPTGANLKVVVRAFRDLFKFRLRLWRELREERKSDAD